MDELQQSSKASNERRMEEKKDQREAGVAVEIGNARDLLSTQLVAGHTSALN